MPRHALSLSAPQVIDRALIRALRDRMDAALAEVGKEFGLSIGTGNASFSATEATFKVNVVLPTKAGATAGGDPTAQRAEADWVVHAHRLGLKQSMLGKSFISRSNSFTIVGLLPNRPKRPVLCKKRGEAKANVIFSVDQILALLK